MCTTNLQKSYYTVLLLWKRDATYLSVKRCLVYSGYNSSTFGVPWYRHCTHIPSENFTTSIQEKSSTFKNVGIKWWFYSLRFKLCIRFPATSVNFPLTFQAPIFSGFMITWIHFVTLNNLFVIILCVGR